MRWLIVLILEALAVLTASGAEPPRFVVENKVQRFTVVNKVGAAPVRKPTDAERYAWLVKGVEEGRSQVMIVGNHTPLNEYIHQERFPSGFMGFADGVYDCFPRESDRQAMMQKREEPADAHPFRPFQSGPSPFTPATPAPSVVVPSTSSAGVVQYPAVTFTPARRVIRGFTSTSDGCVSGFG